MSKHVETYGFWSPYDIGQRKQKWSKHEQADYFKEGGTRKLKVIFTHHALESFLQYFINCLAEHLALCLEIFDF